MGAPSFLIFIQGSERRRVECAHAGSADLADGRAGARAFERCTAAEAQDPAPRLRWPQDRCRGSGGSCALRRPCVAGAAGEHPQRSGDALTERALEQPLGAQPFGGEVDLGHVVAAALAADLDQIRLLVDSVKLESAEITARLLRGEIVAPIDGTVHDFYEQQQLQALKVDEMRVLRWIFGANFRPESNGFFVRCGPVRVEFGATRLRAVFLIRQGWVPNDKRMVRGDNPRRDGGSV